MKFYKDCLPARTLAFLETQTEPVSAREIGEALAVKPKRIGDMLPDLVLAKMISRTGRHKHYRYSIIRADDGTD